MALDLDSLVPCRPPVGLRGRIGDYETIQFDDARVDEPLAKFQAAIEDIEVNLTNV